MDESLFTQVELNGETYQHFHEMLGEHPSMLEIFEQITRVAPTEASVLIRGETGTGKELVARALHQLSHRRSGPFRAINCATLTPELLASELFGHKRGAFTGAVSDKKGLFELANHGTLFLDEIAELPLMLQARLLRVIQEKQFIPVGGTEPVNVDVRLLSATHRALRAEVENHRFRSDLMYRLRVIPLYLPALKDRGEDLLTLTRYLIALHSEQSHLKPKKLSHEAELAIRSYSWPGNIRELSNTVEYALIMGREETILYRDLPPELRGIRPVDSSTQLLGGHDQARGEILDALATHRGHKGETAKALGISRATLWRKMRAYGLIKGGEADTGSEEFESGFET